MTDPAPLKFETARAWAAWLAANHATQDEVWMSLAKKGSGHKSVTHEEAVDVALCYGWIDGQGRGSGGGDFYFQRFTPRRKRSPWSARNRDKALELIESGRMKPAGLREVERAREDGRWEAAYQSPAAAEVPPDLEAALDKKARAKAFFATLDSRNRYAILHRIEMAKRAETRVKRIAEFVAMLSRKETIYPVSSSPRRARPGSRAPARRRRPSQ